MSFFNDLFKATREIAQTTIGICANFKSPLPTTCQGYRINYNEPYHEKCPDHGCICYQTFENPSLAYCPKCGRILIHEDDCW